MPTPTEVSLNFTTKEWEIFNNYKRKDTKGIDMSVFGNILYLFHVDHNQTVQKGMREILYFINSKRRFFDKLALSSLQASIKRLCANGLLNISLKGIGTRVSTYVLGRFCNYFCEKTVDNVVDNLGKKTNLDAKLNTNSVAEPLDNTTTDDMQKIHTIDNKKNLDIRNINMIYDSFEKVENIASIYNLIKETLKDCKIRSKRLKEEIIDRIHKNVDNITKKFAKNYILKVVLCVKGQEENRRRAYAAAINQKFNNDNWFSNYSGQKEYTPEELARLEKDMFDNRNNTL